MSVDADISTSQDLLGKIVTDLQEDIIVSDDGAAGTVDGISGTLKHVTGYTGFSGDPNEQSGNYLVIHCEVPDVADATITAEIIGGHHGPVTLDDDGILIARIESTTQSIKVTASKTGRESVVKTFALTNLTLEGE